MPKRRQRFRRLPPGCGLCGELVSQPHYCVASYERGHAAWVAGNERYRAALAERHSGELKALESDPESVDYNPPRTGLLDLAAWGDWAWSEHNRLDTSSLDERAVRRAAKRLAKLPRMYVSDLAELYVWQGEWARESRRNYSGNYRLDRGELPPLTIAELAYLRAS